MNIVLFGPPGAGKGTQSELLIKRRQMKHIATGDILREAVKNQTALGLKAKSFMDSGGLVPDDVVIGLVEEVLRHLNGQAFILDGFPRTVPQAAALESMMAGLKVKLDKAVFLEVPRVTLLSRLTGRRVCTNCGAVYHLESKPMKTPGVCDNCGGQVVQRKDDHPDVIGNRLEAYDKSTSPLKAYYAQQGLFVQVDGLGATEDVYRRIAEQLK